MTRAAGRRATKLPRASQAPARAAAAPEWSPNSARAPSPAPGGGVCGVGSKKKKK
jgi:hypothetical protein